MIQCLLLSGSLFLFSADGDRAINLGTAQGLWKEDHKVISRVTGGDVFVNGLPEDMTLFQIMQECDNVAWENYDEVVSD